MISIRCADHIRHCQMLVLQSCKVSLLLRKIQLDFEMQGKLNAKTALQRYSEEAYMARNVCTHACGEHMKW